MCDGNFAVSQDSTGNYNNVISISDQRNGISRAMSVKSFQSSVNELSGHIKFQNAFSPIIIVRSISGNLETQEGKVKQPIKLVMGGHMIGKPANRHASLKETGSADAWFVDEDKQVFGVADGVSE